MSKNIKDMTLRELEVELNRIESTQDELRKKRKLIRFMSYPKKTRAIMKRIGWGPEDADKVIHRITGTFMK